MQDLNANDLAYLLNRLELEKEFHDKDPKLLSKGSYNCWKYRGFFTPIEDCSCKSAAFYKSRRSELINLLNQELTKVIEYDEC